MAFRISRRVPLLLAAVVLLPVLAVIFSPQESESCGPDFIRPIFTFSIHPDRPLANYAKGELGIVKPEFARSYLAVAYRHLMDKPLTTKEQQQAVALWNSRLYSGNTKVYTVIDSTIPDWDSLANTVLPISSDDGSSIETPTPGVDDGDRWMAQTSPWRLLEGDDYQSYYSITPDAFQNATKRLQELIRQFGRNSQEAKDWVYNQRLAFIAADSIGPSELRDVTSVIGANRQYQVASAYFYRGRYDEARDRFEAIGRNTASPWQPMGLYLAARALTRKSTIGGDTLALDQALSILDKITEPAVERAVLFQKDYVQGLLDPLTQIAQLSRRVQDNDDRFFEHELDDYTKLLDRVLYELEWYEMDTRAFDKLPVQLRQDDMTDWIYTFQSRDTLSFDHAIARYKATGSKPWLIAVLSKTREFTGEYFSAVIDTSDPAYESVAYYRAAMLSANGHSEQAKRLLDEALTTNLNASARNDFMILRQRFSTDMRDLLTMLVRTSLEETDDYFQGWVWATGQTGPEFDDPAREVLNRSLSLDRLMEAIRLKMLPRDLELDLMRTVWTRSVIVGREEYAKDLASRLATEDTVLSAYMRRYLTMSTSVDRHREAIFILLKHPGLSPLVWEAPGRSTIQEIDSYRANGWCPIYADSTVERHYRGLILQPIPIPFLTSTDRANADNEWRILSVSSPAVNYLANETVKWAKAVPKDPRVAEALHLAVKSSRYGCNDERTGKYSSAAFKLLHSNYGKTKWAKQTPYWFGEY